MLGFLTDTPTSDEAAFIDSPHVLDVELLRGDAVAPWPGFPHQFWPVVRNHTDPTDILKPEVYEPFNPIWFNPEKQRRIAQYCGGPAPK